MSSNPCPLVLGPELELHTDQQKTLGGLVEGMDTYTKKR